MMTIIVHRFNAIFVLAVVLACSGFVRDAMAERSELGTKKVQRLVANIATKNGTVPPALALAVAKVESSFRANAESPVGAKGVMQIMPATAEGVFDISADKLGDPEINIRIGVSYLERLYRRYGGRWDLALSHYNGGSLKRKNGRYISHSYTRGYVAKVMRYWRQFQRTSAAVHLARLDQKTHAVRFLASDRKLERLQVRASNNGWWDKKLGWRQYLNIADRLLDRKHLKSRDSRVLKPQRHGVGGIPSKHIEHPTLLRFRSERSSRGHLHNALRFM